MNHTGQEGEEVDQKESRCYGDWRGHIANILQLGTLLRSKRKLEELSTVIQESRRAAH